MKLKKECCERYKKKRKLPCKDCPRFAGMPKKERKRRFRGKKKKK